MTDRELAEARLVVIRRLLEALREADPNPEKGKERLRRMSRGKDIEALIDAAALSETDKEILRRRFVQKQDYATIADFVGYSERTVRRNADRAAQVVSNLP